MSEQQQEQEIEKILKEIFTEEEYRNTHNWTSRMFFYKLKGTNALFSSGRVEHREGQHIIVDTVFNLDVKYALYVDEADVLSPSSSCIEYHKYDDVIRQFIVELIFPLDLPALFIKSLIKKYKDPLSQVLVYALPTSEYGLYHTYICSYVNRVTPNSPDPSSIFPDKEGIVAFCTTLTNLVRIDHSIGLDKIYDLSYRIYERALKKLETNKGLNELWQEDRVEACSINHIEKIIYNEIEENDRLMREYGIIRVAFPLD